MKTSHTLLCLLLLTPTCDRTDEVEAVPAEDAEALHPRAAASPAPTALPSPEQLHAKALAAGPGPVVPRAKVAFDELAGLIDAKYVDGPLSEDELWTGAMEGVLARLVQLPGHEINTLLAPREHEELLVGTQGRVVGVGVMIERVANVVVVRDVIPGGPADQAGLRAGDRILGVDGQRLDALELGAAVDRIRGPEGSAVELFVQRDIEEWTETVTRGLVEFDSVEGRMLDGGVGYVRISSFSERSPAELDAKLQTLTEQGASALVLDLRACPGGLLEASLQAASRFVPAGKLLLRVEHREGGEPAKEHRSEGEYPWQGKPLVVLIGPKTASSAEILADAIREHDRGLLVGEPTLGKHTVESVHELSGGWAVKLSVGRFATASGETKQGVGVPPDIRIPAAEGGHGPTRVEQLDPASDPALATALGLLRND
ncbi:MAG: PDZ domain-containing protein [Myxococcales bacterium]|nr:PDZ domain-containing protein [Myxococcales bacterium]